METKFAIIADRDDNAGDRAVFLAVDREILDALGELVMAFLEPGDFDHQRVGPFVLGDLLQLRETLSMRSISPAISGGRSAAAAGRDGIAR